MNKVSPTGGVKRQREIDIRPLAIRQNHFILGSDVTSPIAKLIKREPGTSKLPSSTSLTFEELANQCKASSSPTPSNTTTGFGDVRIKSENELCTSSESESDESESEDEPSQSSRSPPERKLDQLNSPKLVQFGSGVFFTSHINSNPIAKKLRPSPPVESRSERFCYNCKRYGHLRRECNSPWHHWWPKEYLDRHRWLRRKLFESNRFRLTGRIREYRLATRKIEEDIEKSEQQLENQYWTPGGQNRVTPHRPLIRAKRRCSPEPPQPSLCGPNQQFDFDCHKLIEHLQQQVNQLRLSLFQFQQGSPPIYGRNPIPL